jgi:ribonuclease VapC
LSRRHGDDGARDLDLLLAKLRIEVAPVAEQQAGIARCAYRRFGKGQGHLAGLNYGDFFAYALAVATGEPLLFKGDDFSHTNVTAAPY